MTLDDVQVVLSISRSQAYALVRRGDLRAIQIGGRRQWRVSVEALEEYIAAAYRATAEELGLQVED
ncbi:helix-turn-helix domain-containing protein [Brachybacterium epidermidis]|uniref:helix-turn-helix domain-containing protein n=1 Tax=Brachybacterium epidermidis TaxID=2781983 RepID=UPI00398F7775